MKFTLPTLNDPSYFFTKNYAAALEKDSGGRIKTEIYPASQLGSIPRQIEGTQFGAIQCAVIPPEFFVGVDERFEVMAAPGLVDSMAHGQTRRGRSGGEETDARPRRQQGAARRRAVHERAAIGDRQNTDPSPCRLQGQENPRARLAVPDGADGTAWRNAGGDDARRRRAGACSRAPSTAPSAASSCSLRCTSGTRRNMSPKPASRRSMRSPRSTRPGTNHCRADLQKIVDDDAAAQQAAIAPLATEIVEKARKGWTDQRRRTDQPAARRAGRHDEDLRQRRSRRCEGRSRRLEEAYKIVTDAAQRTQ